MTDLEPGTQDELRLDHVVSLAKDVLHGAGYVCLREKSYRQAQERQRVAEALRKAEEEAAEHARQWAVNCLDESRRLRDRLEFVYGEARAHGVTVEQLSGGPNGA